MGLVDFSGVVPICYSGFLGRAYFLIYFFARPERIIIFFGRGILVFDRSIFVPGI